MARPPGPKQKRYRGRIRDDMRSSKNHLAKILNWNAFYNAGPFDKYPNQLFSVADNNTIAAAYALLNTFLAAKGPIPSR